MKRIEFETEVEESSARWARRLLESNLSCTTCGAPVRRERATLGYKTCLPCGEKAATQARMGWCVVQTYGKGGYQYVTQESAKTTLRNTNQKNTRGEIK